MKIEETSGALRILGERLFALCEELAGVVPQRLASQDWYRATSEKGVFLYFRFVSERARKHPPLSVHLLTWWDDHFVGEQEGIVRGNNWFGSHPSAELTVLPDQGALAEKFVRRAFELRRRTAAR